MSQDLDLCRDRTAAVESTSRPRNWHREPNERLDTVQGQLDDLESRLSKIEW